MEAVSLVKDQKVDITKSNPGLTKVSVGLGWDVNAGNSGSFDLDAFIIAEDEAGVKQDIIYFGNKTSKDGAVVHQGDNLTGAGDGDDETINIDFSKVSPTIKKLIVAVNIYQAASKHQNFGMVKNAFVRVYNTETGAELLKYDLSEDASSGTGVVFGTVYNHNGEWKFESNSSVANGDINEIAATL